MNKETSPFKRFADWVRKPPSPIDFATDTPDRKDPDEFSQTLRRYHVLLGSKVLPSGAQVVLNPHKGQGLINLRSGDLEVRCSSDATVLPVIGGTSRAVLDQLLRKEIETVRALGRTIGGRIIFPANRGQEDDHRRCARNEPTSS